MHMQKHEFLLIFAHFTAACAKNNSLRCKATIIQTQTHLMSDLLYKVLWENVLKYLWK